ncbi:MAG: DUF4838 domain-containing protein [Anaerolineae bacterium]
MATEQGKATGKLTLVHNGIGRFVIVLPANASDPVKHGAKELQKHLALMSGAELPIQEAPSEREIRLQPDSGLSEEEFKITTEGQRLVIAGGGKRSVLYGCYALLEDVLGVRWYTSRITHVPKKRTVVVGPLAIHDKPAFEYREPFYTEAFERDWAVRNRTNGHHQLLDETVGGKIAYGKYFVHSFNGLVDPEIYFDKHPEYFSLINGKRMKGEYQICLSNPDVLKIAIESVRRWIKETPDATIMSVAQNDVYFACQCDACQAIVKEEGAESGPVLRFVNAVADAIAPDYPHILIDTLAYQYTEDPPLLVRPRPNVRIRLAPIYACFGHPLDGCEANNKAFANLKAWGEITNQLYVWHYSTNFANYLQPFPNLDEVIRDIQLFKQHGTVGLFYEGGYAPGGCCAQAELESFLMAKLMWKPERPAQPIIDDFLQGVYGKAASLMQRWLDLIHDVVRTQNVHLRIWDAPTAPYLADSILEQGKLIFDAAEQMVADQPVTLEMVQRARLALDYVLLMRSLPKCSVADGVYKRVEPVDAALLNVLQTKIEQYGITQVREAQPVAKFLERVTDRTEWKVLTLESDQLRLDVVPDLGGRIVQLVAKANGQNLMREPAVAEGNYPQGGGHVEYAGIGDRGMGAREVYKGTLKKAGAKTPAQITLRAILKNGVVATRSLVLVGNQLNISTELENPTDETQHVALRSHGEFTWPDGSEPCVGYTNTNNESVCLGLPETGHSHTFPYVELVGSEWVAALGGARLTQAFANQAIATVSFSGSRAERGLSLDLTASPQAMLPGTKLTLDQTWTVTIA